MGHEDAEQGTITVFLADDNLIVREGVRALIERHGDLRVVGMAADHDEVVSGAAATEPQVLVTDIRMPPAFQREGIDAAKEVRKRHPGTGMTDRLAAVGSTLHILSQPGHGTTVNGTLPVAAIAERGR